MAGAFQVSGQGGLLEPYVDKYLDLARTVVQDKGVWLASVALQRLFPLANPPHDTLRPVDRWLEQPDIDATARRSVTDGRDDLACALAPHEMNARLAPIDLATPSRRHRI